MSLLQNLPYSEYKKALAFTAEQCERIAQVAGLKMSFNNNNKPGELLLKALDRCGCTIQRYTQFISANVKTILVYHKPQSKVAVLIANDKYVNLSKLVTPSVDCDSLASALKNLGFIIVLLKNILASDIKPILSKVFDSIPENSYCFIYYAGHGCQLCNTKCMLSIDCPVENIQLEHCVTENFVLKEAEKSKLELCILIMDMCRLYLDRATNPQIYAAMASIEDYTIHRNLLIGYSTQSAQAAYEVLQIECSTTIDTDVTYELKTGDTERIVPGASQYVNALCTRLGDGLDVSSMLDKVHGDVENSLKKQRPIKVQCGVDKRSLYDPVMGDTSSLLLTLKEISTEFKDSFLVF